MSYLKAMNRDPPERKKWSKTETKEKTKTNNVIMEI